MTSDRFSELMVLQQKITNEFAEIEDDALIDPAASVGIILMALMNACLVGMKNENMDKLDSLAHAVMDWRRKFHLESN